MEVVAIPSLLEALAPLPDPRQARGRRHPLAPVLALACAALLCDRDGLRGIARWGAEQGAAALSDLGFPRAVPPSLATLHRVFRGLDAAAFERAVAGWVAAVRAALAPPPLPAVAVDGKTLRRSRTAALPAAQLLGAFGHDLRQVLAQVPVDPAAGEVAALPDLLAGLALEGWVVTLDAKFAYRPVAVAIRGKGGTT